MRAGTGMSSRFSTVGVTSMSSTGLGTTRGETPGTATIIGMCSCSSYSVEPW